MAGRLSFPHHRKLLLVVVVSVLAAHLGLGQWLVRSVIGSGHADGPPPAIEVAFVHELAPALPPVARPSIAPLPTKAVAAPALDVPGPLPVASAPEAPPPPEEVVAEDDGLAPAPDPQVVYDGPPDDDAAVAFDWPPATRLHYDLTGQYRGPLYGSGQVEWLRDGSHYQVRVNIDVDPAFTRQLVSDGVITPQGLSPRRYDEETRVPLLAPRTHTLQFESGQVRLSNGMTELTPEGVQDSASQFVQMTWLFLTDPERLAVGRTLDLPLALPRRVGVWTYDVTEAQPLALPFGTIDTFHLVPRQGSARAGEFSAELWLAPSLQYLPVRILVRQSAEVWLDLRLKDKPLQAAPASAPAETGTLPELKARRRDTGEQSK
ncbi:MAG: DUF3108 domain-containing protein [Proteobacteria bacterium]|nr:DUF3108 domain-containing protein [Pseudomonadota bacterium]